VKRKYVMKRPILKLNAEGNIDDMTEDEFFNTYYEADKGVYCRIQAWPLENDFVVKSTVEIEYFLEKYNYPSVTNAGVVDPAAAVSGTLLHPGVTMKMQKKSKIKLDEPIYQGSPA